jgi:hypothetical protein
MMDLNRDRPITPPNSLGVVDRDRSSILAV